MKKAESASGKTDKRTPVAALARRLAFALAATPRS